MYLIRETAKQHLAFCFRLGGSFLEGGTPVWRRRISACRRWQWREAAHIYPTKACTRALKAILRAGMKGICLSGMRWGLGRSKGSWIRLERSRTPVDKNGKSKAAEEDHGLVEAQLQSLGFGGYNHSFCKNRPRRTLPWFQSLCINDYCRDS
jgi:hypothetical protein